VDLNPLCDSFNLEKDGVLVQELIKIKPTFDETEKVNLRKLDVLEFWLQLKSREDLLEATQRAWDNITSEYIDKLIFSMPRKCTEVIKHNGYSTCY
jgi:hypothetical protein